MSIIHKALMQVHATYELMELFLLSSHVPYQKAVRTW